MRRRQVAVILPERILEDISPLTFFSISYGAHAPARGPIDASWMRLV